MESTRRNERKRKARCGYQRKPKFKGNGHMGSIRVKQSECNRFQTTKHRFFEADRVGENEASFVGLEHQQCPSLFADDNESPKSASGRKILSRRKLDLSHEYGIQSEESKQYFIERHGVRFFDLEIIKYVLSLLLCPDCYHADLIFQEVYSKRSGEASFCHVTCQNCNWKYVFYSSKKYKSKVEVNQRLVYAMCSIGKG